MSVERVFIMATQPSAPSASCSSAMIEEERRLSLSNNLQLSRLESKKSSPPTMLDAECTLQSTAIHLPEKFDEMSYTQIGLVLFR